MTDPSRILLVRLSHLGDVVHALPVFHAVRERFPRAEIAWAIQPEFAGLVRGLPGLDRVFEFDRRGGIAAWRRLVPALRNFAPDLAIDAQGNWKSAVVTRFAGAARRVGMHRRDWRERSGSLLINDRAQPSRGAHALERMRALVDLLAPQAELRVDPACSEAELERGLSLWRELGGRQNSCILHLAHEPDVRSWPTASFIRLADRLLQAERHVLMLSGPGEEVEGRVALRALGDSELLTHCVGQRGLRDLAALFSAAAEDRAHLFACDSGPMHLAVACGVNTTCLSGPQDPARTGPYHLVDSKARIRVLRSESPPECAPCLARECTHERGPVCMSELSVDRVFSAASAATS